MLPRYLRKPFIRATLGFSLIITVYLYVKLGSLMMRETVDAPSNDPASRHRPDKTAESEVKLSTNRASSATLTSNAIPQRGTIPQTGYRITISYATTESEVLMELTKDTIDVPVYWDSLPQCPEDKIQGSDNIALDTLRKCGNPNEFTFFPELEAWLYEAKVHCAGRFVGFGKDAALLRYAVLDKSKCHSRLSGGEILEEIINEEHTEYDEHCLYDAGFFLLPCGRRFVYTFRGVHNNYLNNFMASVDIFNESLAIDDYVDRKTIALVRLEYYNIYHTIAELYNAFLGTVFLNVDPKQSNVIFVDAHPRHSFDNVWKRLFHSARRVKELAGKTLYQNLFWTKSGHSSYLLNFSSLEPPPYLEDFLKFILDGFNIRTHPKRDCKKLQILFVWREDYVSSMRNPSGKISRKISNTMEILRALRDHFPNFAISGTRLEALHMKTQLFKISRTDILIGMHGAGLTHSLFLPSHAGLIELIPSYFHEANEHFKAFARWRKLNYLRWVNNSPDSENLPSQTTKVSPSIIKELVEKMVQLMCSV